MENNDEWDTSNYKKIFNTYTLHMFRSVPHGTNTNEHKDEIKEHNIL